MSCCHYYELVDGNESVFTVDVSTIKYGPGAMHELGSDAGQLGLKRVAVFTDRNIAGLQPFSDGIESLKKAGMDVVIYDNVSVEPTDKSFMDATEFARELDPDGYVSIGGGSVIDTCKAANLYATWPADFLDYVNAPIGLGKPVPGQLKPHIACPTTAGTGSECTGITVFDYLELELKTGIASRALRPARAVIDPRFTQTLPANVVAASGFDVLSHALESYTASPYSNRVRSAEPLARPMSQGANPYSDIGCREALKMCGDFLVRATRDAADLEARYGMMFAATLAGIAFGNSGVHIPHGMAYSVAGLVRDFRPQGYPDHQPICPHGISVIVNAPAAFRFTAQASPARHREGAACLGAEPNQAGPGDEGELLATRVIEMMQHTGMPNGVGGVGYGGDDVNALAAGAWQQQRLLANSPRPLNESTLAGLYQDAMAYWS